MIKNTEALEEILTGQDALEAAPALVEVAEEAYFNLGGVLAHIYHEGLYKGAGYDGAQGFADYTKAELGVDYRKASATRCNWCRMLMLPSDLVRYPNGVATGLLKRHPRRQAQERSARRSPQRTC